MGGAGRDLWKLCGCDVREGERGLCVQRRVLVGLQYTSLPTTSHSQLLLHQNTKCQLKPNPTPEKKIAKKRWNGVCFSRGFAPVRHMGSFTRGLLQVDAIDSCVVAGASPWCWHQKTLLTVTQARAAPHKLHHHHLRTLGTPSEGTEVSIKA